MKYKQGKLFTRITKSQDYHRIGKENWEKLKNNESVDFEPLKELVDKGYLIEEKKENKKGDK
jgi:hypothetical protein